MNSDRQHLPCFSCFVHAFSKHIIIIIQPSQGGIRLGIAIRIGHIISVLMPKNISRLHNSSSSSSSDPDAHSIISATATLSFVRWSWIAQTGPQDKKKHQFPAPPGAFIIYLPHTLHTRKPAMRERLWQVVFSYAYGRRPVGQRKEPVVAVCVICTYIYIYVGMGGWHGCKSNNGGVFGHSGMRNG